MSIILRLLACQYADSILRTQLVVVVGLIKLLKLFDLFWNAPTQRYISGLGFVRLGAFQQMKDVTVCLWALEYDIRSLALNCASYLRSAVNKAE